MDSGTGGSANLCLNVGAIKHVPGGTSNILVNVDRKLIPLVALRGHSLLSTALVQSSDNPSGAMGKSPLGVSPNGSHRWTEH